jgi:hypothetical protein
VKSVQAMHSVPSALLDALAMARAAAQKKATMKLRRFRDIARLLFSTVFRSGGRGNAARGPSKEVKLFG